MTDHPIVKVPWCKKKNNNKQQQQQKKPQPTNQKAFPRALGQQNK